MTDRHKRKYLDSLFESSSNLTVMPLDRRIYDYDYAVKSDTKSDDNIVFFIKIHVGRKIKHE